MSDNAFVSRTHRKLSKFKNTRKQRIQLENKQKAGREISQKRICK